MPPEKQIRIDVNFTPVQTDEIQLKDRNLVVIDVLRASTTIAMALQNGAKEIIPVGNIENAVKISGSLFGDVTLRGGERNGKMIEGFNLGNSPLEYSEAMVKGKSIIFMTTNGSAAIVKGRYAKYLMVAGFVNLNAIVSEILNLKGNVLIICAGKEGVFCLEDAVCAGRIINTLLRGGKADIVLDDGASAAAALDVAFGKNILKMLKNTDHGKYLAGIGFSEDLSVCARIDSIPVIPVLLGSVIKLKIETARPADHPEKKNRGKSPKVT